jgi:hypothetical protein
MRRLILTGMGIAAVALSGCSEKAADKVNEAGNAISRDITHGINNADDDIQAGLSHTGKQIDKFGDDVGDAASDAAKKVGRETDKAQKDAGEALEKAGKDIQH